MLATRRQNTPPVKVRTNPPSTWRKEDPFGILCVKTGGQANEAPALAFPQSTKCADPRGPPTGIRKTADSRCQLGDLRCNSIHVMTCVVCACHHTLLRLLLPAHLVPAPSLPIPLLPAPTFSVSPMLTLGASKI